MHTMMAALCVLLLSGCGARLASVPENTTVQTDMTTVSTEPVQSETEAAHTVELYERNTSEYDFSFEKVLLRFDWTDMTFALKCFDGSVVTSTVEREQDAIICVHDHGRLMLTQYLHNGEQVLGNTKYSRETGRNYDVDQLMFCPQADITLSYYFVLAEDQEQPIIVDSNVMPLDDYKNVFMENYYFHDVIEENGERIGYSMSIYHFPMQDKWSFSFASQQTDVVHAEHPDGTIAFSCEGKQWHFHRDEDALYFDGGDPLFADNGIIPQGEYKEYYRETDIPAGEAFYLQNTNYVYDALYILPGENLEEYYAAIQLDTKNQYIKIQCCDGKVLRGPCTFIDNDHLYCNFEIPDYAGTRTAYVTLTPNGHALGVSNGWMLNIGPGELGDRFYFFPAQGVTPQESIEK